jgi:hypothetical protein
LRDLFDEDRFGGVGRTVGPAKAVEEGVVRSGVFALDNDLFASESVAGGVVSDPGFSFDAPRTGGESGILSI